MYVAALVDKYYQNATGLKLGFSNEILCILAAKGVSKLREVKIGGQKKSALDPVMPRGHLERKGRKQQFVSDLTLLSPTVLMPFEL